MSAQSARDCHPHGLPPVIRPGHPEDGAAYILVSSGSEFGRAWNLDEARGVAINSSRFGDLCELRHLHEDGSSCLVATYRYGLLAREVN